MSAGVYFIFSFMHKYMRYKIIDPKLSQSKKKCGIRHRNTKYTELLQYKTFNNFTQNIQTN